MFDRGSWYYEPFAEPDAGNAAVTESDVDSLPADTQSASELLWGNRGGQFFASVVIVSHTGLCSSVTTASYYLW
jgi:hypothetical protein